MIKRRNIFTVIALLCAVSLIFPVGIFAQDEGPDAAGSGTKGAELAGAEAGKETKAGISTGTIAWGTVAVALIVGGILALAGSSGGGGSSITTTQHH